MNSFRAVSRVNCLYEIDVSRTISVRIVRDLVTSVSYTHLTWLIAREEFIEFSRRQSSGSCKVSIANNNNKKNNTL
jgi:hypothetical protein